MAVLGRCRKAHCVELAPHIQRLQTSLQPDLDWFPWWPFVACLCPALCPPISCFSQLQKGKKHFIGLYHNNGRKWSEKDNNSKQSHWWEDKLFNLREAVVESVHQIKRFTAHMSLSQISVFVTIHARAHWKRSLHSGSINGSGSAWWTEKQSLGLCYWCFFFSFRTNNGYLWVRSADPQQIMSPCGMHCRWCSL